MNKYLTFMLNEQKYGIDISQIRELIKFKEINSIPNSKKVMWNFLLGIDL